MVLRFVPYIGAILAASLPIALAAAVGADWTMTLLTVILFAVIEPLTGHVVEPLVCGRTAGLSPVAVVIAASFWTWQWGPLGLLLSTPLTLCLVVFAKHVERLQVRCNRRKSNVCYRPVKDRKR
jgi:predicted PurR-regulated permease PerM